MLDEYRVRRDRLYEWLSADPRIGLQKPAGAFYMFPDVSEFLSPDGYRRGQPIPGGWYLVLFGAEARQAALGPDRSPGHGTVPPARPVEFAVAHCGVA